MHKASFILGAMDAPDRDENCLVFITGIDPLKKTAVQEFLKRLVTLLWRSRWPNALLR